MINHETMLEKKPSLAQALICIHSNLHHKEVPTAVVAAIVMGEN